MLLPTRSREDDANQGPDERKSRPEAPTQKSDERKSCVQVSQLQVVEKTEQARGARFVLASKPVVKLPFSPTLVPKVFM